MECRTSHAGRSSVGHRYLSRPGHIDGDGIVDGDDNCPSDSNPSQRNTYGGGFGDACDACSGTEASATVDNDGCSLDQCCPCGQDEDGTAWGSHGKDLKCYKDEVFRFRLIQLVTGEEAEALRMAARDGMRAAASCLRMT